MQLESSAVNVSWSITWPPCSEASSASSVAADERTRTRCLSSIRSAERCCVAVAPTAALGPPALGWLASASSRAVASAARTAASSVDASADSATAPGAAADAEDDASAAGAGAAADGAAYEHAGVTISCARGDARGVESTGDVGPAGAPPVAPPMERRRGGGGGATATLASHARCEESTAKRRSSSDTRGHEGAAARAPA